MDIGPEFSLADSLTAKLSQPSESEEHKFGNAKRGGNKIASPCFKPTPYRRCDKNVESMV